MSVHNGQEFSTRDRDNDGNSKECAAERQGGWWYGNGDFCGPSGLNGKHFKIKTHTLNKLKGILWTSWKSDYSFKSTEMKIKRV